MRISTMKWMAGAFALSAFLAVSGASHASCDENDRIASGDSSCLSAGWSNSCENRIFGKCISWSSTYWAQAASQCTSGSSKVVAKVDIAGGSDRTWHLHNTDNRSGSSSTNKTNGIYCCNDLGRC